MLIFLHFFIFFFNDTATTEIYTLSLHDALPIWLDGVAGVDADLDRLAERVRALAVEADDVAGELRRYGEGLEAEPGRLDVVEERLGALGRLKRKRGGTIPAGRGRAQGRRARRHDPPGARQAADGAGAGAPGAEGGR